MTNKSKLFSAICLTVALSRSSAFAQMNAAMGVTLPQNFTVHGMKLAAGEYSIHELTGSGANPVLLLRSATGVSTNLLAQPITNAQQTAPKGSSVTFHKVGGQLQLDEIWFVGNEVGYRVISLSK